MLPVVAPIGVVTKQMWFHTIAMIAVSGATLYSAGLPVWTYPIAALLGVGFALQLRDLSTNANRIFHGSITYLSLYSILLVAAVLI